MCVCNPFYMYTSFRRFLYTGEKLDGEISSAMEKKPQIQTDFTNYAG